MNEWKKQKIDGFIGSERVMGSISGSTDPRSISDANKRPFDHGQRNMITQFRELVEGMMSDEADYASPVIPVLGIRGLESTDVLIIRNTTHILHLLAEKYTKCFEQILLLLPKLKELADSPSHQVSQLPKKLVQFLEQGDPLSIASLAREISVSEGAIFIVGAGISYESDMFLTRELPPIIWLLLKRLGIPSPKDFYSKDPGLAWKKIKEDSEVFVSFKEHIKRVTDTKPFGKAHQALAEIFEKKSGVQIISLNWDSFIERAYSGRFNKKMPKINRDGTKSGHALWKLHGDIDELKTKWVLPHEKGVVFQSLKDVIFAAPLPVVIIGYGETDTVIKEELIQPLSRSLELHRIGPEISHMKGIKGEAEKVLPALAAKLLSD